jgi:hypothetical protein
MITLRPACVSLLKRFKTRNSCSLKEKKLLLDETIKVKIKQENLQQNKINIENNKSAVEATN